MLNLSEEGMFRVATARSKHLHVGGLLCIEYNILYVYVRLSISSQIANRNPCVRILQGTIVYVYCEVPLYTYTARYNCVRILRGTIVYVYCKVQLCTYTVRYQCVRILQVAIVYVYCEVPV